MFSASFTREQHTCIITTPGAGCLDHSRRRCGGGAELAELFSRGRLADLSLAHFTMSVETFCVTTPAQHWHGHGGHSTKHYNQLHYKQCYPSCGVLYRPVFCHMTPLLTSGWWWWDHRDLIIDVSAEVVWDLSTRDSCLKVGSCCPIYPYVWVMYYVLSRYLLTHWRNHLFNSM